MPVLRIFIDKNGKIVFDAEGYTGRACLDDLNKVVELLKEYGVDVKIEQQQLKPEYYRASATPLRKEVEA